MCWELLEKEDTAEIMQIASSGENTENPFCAS